MFLNLLKFPPMFLNDADTAAAGGGGDILMALLSYSPILIIVVIFYFMLIRPEGKRKKQRQAMLNELIVGDEITTSGGIVGRVISIKDDTVTLETGADRVRIKIMRWAIASKGEKVSDS